MAAGALSPLLVQAEKAKPSTAADFKDWESVRREFELAPDYIHLALFYLASHPRPVRQAIEQYRAKMDANPFVAVDSAIFEPTNQKHSARGLPYHWQLHRRRREGRRVDPEHDYRVVHCLPWTAVG